MCPLFPARSPQSHSWLIHLHMLIGPQDVSHACVDFPIGWRTGISAPIIRVVVLLYPLNADIGFELLLRLTWPCTCIRLCLCRLLFFFFNFSFLTQSQTQCPRGRAWGGGSGAHCCWRGGLRRRPREGRLRRGWDGAPAEPTGRSRVWAAARGGLEAGGSLLWPYQQVTRHWLPQWPGDTLHRARYCTTCSKFLGPNMAESIALQTYPIMFLSVSPHFVPFIPPSPPFPRIMCT